MVLLQISEPGAANEHGPERKLGLGIDLGTTHSLVAHVVDGSVVVLPDEQGSVCLPSVVHYGEQGVTVGESAEALAGAIRDGQTDRVRYAHADRVPAIVRRAAADAGLYLATAPVLGTGRIELLHVVREQSLCLDSTATATSALADEARSPGP